SGNDSSMGADIAKTSRAERQSHWSWRPQIEVWRRDPRLRSAHSANHELPLRRPILRKYFLVLFIAVVIPLLINGAIEAWFGYRDQRAMLDARLSVEASAAAARIESFLNCTRDQMQWAVQLSWTSASFEDHRIGALQLLRQVPAIAAITLTDGAAVERLTVSRIEPDIIGRGVDRSTDPAVVGARTAHSWYGPVTLNRGSEPYMTMAVAGNRPSVGIAVAQINLKLIWDV